jgi:S1-C subfamily serine protease
MRNNVTGNSGQAPPEELGLGPDGQHDAEPLDAEPRDAQPRDAQPREARPPSGQAPPRPPARPRPRSGQAPPRRPARPRVKARGRRRLVAWVIGSTVGIVVGIVVGLLVMMIASSNSAGSPSAIPSPPQANKQFVESEEGTGADSQANILAATAPGLVHIVSSSGSSIGLGVVLTRSGIVATSAQILRGAGAVTVRVVLSGRSFPAQVVGSDAADGLSLLQIKGGSGFKTIAIGTAQKFPVGAVVTAVGSSGTAKTFTLHVGKVTSLNSAATIDGTRLTGLLQTTSQVLPGEEVGGPVVNLSGQAVGIDVAGAGSGLHNIGFAVPIDRALAVASQIDAKHS